jgi:pimeloyl-ACP methyl ester carboxylesterase
MSSTSSFIEIDGLQIRLLRSQPEAPSSSPPVLVLHGWGASIDAVGSIVSGLGRSAEIVAVDLPGFGRSDPPTAPWTVGRYAAFVVQLAAALSLERFSVLGHSFGARIAIVLADEHPEKLERLLLTGAAGLRPRRRPSYYAKVGLAKVGRLVAAVGGSPGRRLQAALRRRVASADWLAASEALRGTFRLVIAEDLTGRLSRIRVPTLLVWGEQDADTPLWMGERMERLIPDAGLVVLPGAGHYAYAERAGEFNRVAEHFLVEQAAAARA